MSLRCALFLNAKQIALALGMTPAAVRKFQSRYFKEGMNVIVRRKRGGRRYGYLSYAREEQIVNKFRRQVQSGRSLDVEGLQHAFEVSAGHPVSKSTIYRLISRHGLRRFLPKARTGDKDAA